MHFSPSPSWYYFERGPDSVKYRKVKTRFVGYHVYAIWGALVKNFLTFGNFIKTHEHIDKVPPSLRGGLTSGDPKAGLSQPLEESDPAKVQAP